MPTWKTLAALLVTLLLGTSALLAATPPRASNEANPTPTLIVTDWSYLPYVRGIVLGPTVTATNPPPTRTPYVTITPSATNTVAPPPTPTLIVTDRNYLPYVRGLVLGPTVTATTPPPTRTPYVTLTPSATPTATPSQAPTSTATATPSPSPSSTPTATTTVAPSPVLHQVNYCVSA